MKVEIEEHELVDLLRARVQVLEEDARVGVWRGARIKTLEALMKQDQIILGNKMTEIQKLAARVAELELNNLQYAKDLNSKHDGSWDEVKRLEHQIEGLKFEAAITTASDICNREMIEWLVKRCVFLKCQFPSGASWQWTNTSVRGLTAAVLAKIDEEPG